MQQKFLIGVSAAFFLDVSQQSKTEHGSEHEMKYAYLYHRVSARRHFYTIIIMSNFSKTNLNGWHNNTDLGCDVKTLLRSDVRMKIGKEYQGVLRCDSEGIVEDYLSRDPHYTFVETIPLTAGKRNPHVFDGEYITVTRRDDGSLRLNFKELKTDAGFKVERFALGVYNEICMALEGLIEKR